MNRRDLPRSLRRSIALRASEDEVYNEKREYFSILPVYKGFWKPKLVGWCVNSIKVEGASCAAPGGSIGYIVEYEISPVFPLKFSAYRWLAENVQTFEDLYHFTII